MRPAPVALAAACLGPSASAPVSTWYSRFVASSRILGMLTAEKVDAWLSVVIAIPVIAIAIVYIRVVFIIVATAQSTSVCV
jgi:hypothetical protein